MKRDRILIIRTGGLGDTVLLWPAVSAVRRRFPDAQIELMGNRERCELLAVDQGVDLALDIEGSGYHYLFEFSGSIPDEVRARFGSYDLVLVFAAPGDYALAENISACGAREVHAFLSFPPADEKIHVASYAKNCLIGQDVAREGEDPPLPVTDRERAAGRQQLKDSGCPDESIAVVAPGSGSAAKNWAPGRYARLLSGIGELGLLPVLLQGPADHDAVAAVVENLAGSPPAVLTAGSPVALKGLLGESRLFVGNDSGTAQLAAAIGLPSVAIFGPTDPDRFRPWGPAVRIVRSQVDCSPCPSDTMHECPERICLDQVTPELVLEACRSLIDDS